MRRWLIITALYLVMYAGSAAIGSLHPDMVRASMWLGSHLCFMAAQSLWLVLGEDKRAAGKDGAG